MGGDKEAGIKWLNDVIIGHNEEKDEIESEYRNKINKDIRDDELRVNTKQARRECASYHCAHMTSKQRTNERKIMNYEYEIVKHSGEAPRVEATRRVKNKHGILRLAPKSVYKITAIKDIMFDYCERKWGITFGGWNDSHIHTGTQSVMVPFIATVGFFLFNMVNHRLFESISKIYHTTQTEISIDLSLLFDSKTVKRSSENRVTMILLKFHSILADKLELIFFVTQIFLC